MALPKTELQTYSNVIFEHLCRIYGHEIDFTLIVYSVQNQEADICSTFELKRIEAELENVFKRLKASSN